MSSFIMLRLCRNHSAFNSHNFPRTCTTTYLYSMLLCHSNRHAPTRDACRFGTYLVSSGCTYGLNTVSSTPSVVRSLSMPFQLRALHDPLRDYSPPILPLCIQYIQPTCRDCTPHVPRRLWKVAESNRLLIRGSLMSPPRGRTAVAFLRTVCILFQSCRFAPLFRLFLPLFFVSLWYSNSYPDRLLLVKSHYSTSQLHNFA